MPALPHSCVAAMGHWGRARRARAFPESSRPDLSDSRLQLALAFAQSRPSDCGGPDDCFIHPAPSRRAIALATNRWLGFAGIFAAARCRMAHEHAPGTAWFHYRRPTVAASCCQGAMSQ
jgi:hypothetical protein